MNRQKQLAVNLSASAVAFIVNVGISFFLTPYIINSLGVEAYGFVQLGTNFINYATLITIALNSMAGRFITIEIHKNNMLAANKYFTSVILANSIVVGILIIPTVLCVLFIDKIVSVPTEILMDVRILFSFLFANFLIGIVISSFSVSTFATNKLYLSSLRGIESNIIRATILIVLFVFFNPAVFYIGFAAFVVLCYISLFNLYYMNKYLPEIKIKKEYFDIKAVYELISSGIWNSVIHLGNILLQGLNLFMSNVFISATAMGMLAVANTVPLVLSALIGTISSVFMPDFTKLYAQNRMKELLLSIKKSIKILGLITNIPIAILIVFGEEFFKLWVPNQDPKVLQILSILTVSVFIINGSVNSLYNVFTVTNKVKLNAIVLVFTGLVNIPIVLLLLNNTNLGIYAVVGVSSLIGIVRNLMFTVPLGAIYLGLKWNTFYPEIIKSVLGFMMVLIIGFSFNYIFIIDSWPLLILFAILTSVLGFMINALVILNKSDRVFLLKLLRIKG